LARKRRQGKIPAPAWERHARGTLRRQVLGRSPKFYATMGIVVLVLAAIGVVGFAVLTDYIETRNRPNSTALKIDDKELTLKYYTERLKNLVQQRGGAGSQSADYRVAVPSLTEQLIQENIILRFASEQGQSASEDDIKTEVARRLGITADDPNYDARYQEDVIRSGVTESEYRDMVMATVLQNKVKDKFAADVPASAESIHFRQIQARDQVDADELKAQIEGGADFAALAQEKSLDATTKTSGGDAGWVAKGTLLKEVEDYLFSQELGKATTYTPAGGGAGSYVFEVLEKAADRPIEESQKSTLAQRKLQEWVSEKRGQLQVVNSMDLSTGDADKINWALERAYSS